MEPAETRYLQRDSGALAYQVFGRGADVVWLAEIVHHLDLCWTDPHMHAIFERIAESCRMAFVQCRGLGLSDPTPAHATLEEQADDVLAVMDAAGMTRATLVATLTTAGPAALVAARAPDRVQAVVMVNPIAQGPGTGTPHGWEPAELDRFLVGWGEVLEGWGQGLSAAMWHPALATAYTRRLFALLERCSASPPAARAFFDWALQLDVRDVLAQARVPVRVLYIAGGSLPAAPARHVSELLPDATFHELPAPPYGTSIGEYWRPVFDHVEVMATGIATSAADVRLGAVLFTDLVASTELLARVGDHAYSELRSAHERQARVAVERHGGDMHSLTGDGTVSVFDGTSRAIECGLTIAADTAALGLQVRAGVHSGSLEQSHLSLTGMTVHVAARVMAQAGPGEVLVTRAARDLAADDADLEFAARDVAALKGVPGEWELWSVSAATGVPARAVAPQTTPLDRMAMRTARRAPAVARAAVRFGHQVQRRLGR